MKLQIDTEALENSRWRGLVGEKRAEKFRDAMSKKELIVLSKPIVYRERYVHCVKPTKFELMSDGFGEIGFQVVDSRVLVGCHMRSTEAKILVVEFPWGQFQFDKDGCKSSNFTTNGPGVDPETVEKSKSMLAKLFHDDPSNQLVRAVLQHIHERIT